MTKLVIANALSLKVSWTKKFEEPELGKFEVSPNNFNNVMMMTSPRCSCKSTSFSGVTNLMTSAEVVTMPFKDKSLIFAMAIPSTAGDFSELDDQSGYRKMFDTVEGMHPTGAGNTPARNFERCNVRMPTFDIDFGYDDFKEHLRSLGVRAAFQGSEADFSGILDDASRRNLYVTDVAHKAAFSLDRDGVEGAAATAVMMGFRSILPSRDVTVDKPFVFFVKNVETGAVLFIGRVVRP